jgi:predicted nucleic-acid-binding protein
MRTALDTNVLVRFLVRDDEEQAQKAYRLFSQTESAKETLFVPQVVVLETIWVLESVYGIPRQEILGSIDALLRMPVLEFEAQPAIQSFVTSARETKIEPSDVLIAAAAKHAGCERVLTFDKRASKQGPFARLQS